MKRDDIKEWVVGGMCDVLAGGSARVGRGGRARAAPPRPQRRRSRSPPPRRAEGPGHGCWSRSTSRGAPRQAHAGPENTPLYDLITTPCHVYSHPFFCYYHVISALSTSKQGLQFVKQMFVWSSEVTQN